MLVFQHIAGQRGVLGMANLKKYIRFDLQLVHSIAKLYVLTLQIMEMTVNGMGNDLDGNLAKRKYNSKILFLLTYSLSCNTRLGSC